MTNDVKKVRDALARAVARVLETGQPQAVDVTETVANGRRLGDLTPLTDAQAGIAAATWGRAVYGYLVTPANAHGATRIVVMLARGA
jgi:hypothetical protein